MNLADLEAKNIDHLPTKISDVERWTYLTPGEAMLAASCHLRLFRTGPEHITAIVTEIPENRGLSVTNANKRNHIRYQLQLAHGGEAIRIIEHYFPGRADEHFDEVFFLPWGTIGWRRIPLPVIYSEFGRHLIDS